MRRHNGAVPIVQLPAALPIGFTGHRSLPDEATSRKVIRELLKARQESVAARIYGVTSTAAGGDLLFAESCIELGIPLRLLLPAPKEKFREDFDDASWARAEKVISAAMSVEVADAGESGDERYYNCSIETVRQCRLLVALWDGEPSRGLGGAADTKSFAEKLGKPVIWVHSITGAVQVTNDAALQKLTDDPEFDFLNQLPDPAGMVPPHSAHELAEAWFQKVDRSATRLAPQVRRLASFPILYTAAAAVLSGAAARGTIGGAGKIIAALMGITAALLPAILKLKKRQALWARTRMAAEVCRSLLAVWSTPCSFDVVRPETLPELSGMLVSLNLLKMLDGAHNRTALEEFVKTYRKNRLQDQLEYFEKQMKKAKRHAERFRVVTLVSAGLAVLIDIWLVVAELPPFAAALPRADARWLALAASALFQTATVSGALLILNDAARRRQRFQQVHGWLSALATQLVSVRTWRSVLGVVDRVERVLLVELIEWKALTQNFDLPRR
jgi:hypothetical protein